MARFIANSELVGKSLLSRASFGLFGPDHVDLPQQVTSENIVAQLFRFCLQSFQLACRQTSQVELTVKVSLPERGFRPRETCNQRSR